MSLNVWNGTAWQPGDDLKIWNGTQWIQGCMKVWNGTEWVDLFGQNGTVSAGPGGSFAGTPSAISDSSSSAGCGVRLSLIANGALQVISESAGTIVPGFNPGTGFFAVETLLSNSLYTPTPCSPSPPLLSARVVPVSGTSPNGTLNTWVQLGSFNQSWSIIASVPPGGGTVTESGTFRLELSLSANTLNILNSATYTFSGQATSSGSEN
jgi:hypothetical protein